MLTHPPGLPAPQGEDARFDLQSDTWKIHYPMFFSLSLMMRSMLTAKTDINFILRPADAQPDRQ